LSSIGDVDTDRGKHDTSIINDPGSDFHKPRDAPAFVYSTWTSEFFVILEMKPVASPGEKTEKELRPYLCTFQVRFPKIAGNFESFCLYNHLNGLAFF